MKSPGECPRSLGATIWQAIEEVEAFFWEAFQESLRDESWLLAEERPE